MKIEVSWGDIWRGKPGRASMCPVSRAIQRAGIKDAVVSYCAVGFWRRGDAGYAVISRVALPLRAQQFIVAFDCSSLSWLALFRVLWFRPFSFELQMPPAPKVLAESSNGARPGIDFAVPGILASAK